MDIKTLYVEKKAEFNLKSRELFEDLKVNLKIDTLTDINIVNRYDIQGVNEGDYLKISELILSERQIDNTYNEILPTSKDQVLFGVRFLPAQYDQRADSAIDCIKLLTENEDVKVISSEVIILSGNISLKI